MASGSGHLGPGDRRPPRWGHSGSHPRLPIGPAALTPGCPAWHKHNPHHDGSGPRCRSAGVHSRGRLSRPATPDDGGWGSCPSGAARHDQRADHRAAGPWRSTPAPGRRRRGSRSGDRLGPGPRFGCIQPDATPPTPPPGAPARHSKKRAIRPLAIPKAPAGHFEESASASTRRLPPRLTNQPAAGRVALVARVPPVHPRLSKAPAQKHRNPVDLGGEVD